MRGNKHLFEIQENSYSGRTNSKRNPMFPLGTKAKGFFEKGEGKNYINNERENYINQGE